jgi:hypothetical protein
MFKEFQQIRDNSGSEEEFVKLFCYLITEKGLGYSEVFGEEITLEFENPVMAEKYGKIKLTRPGIPYNALLEIIKFIDYRNEEEKKAYEKIKRRR